MDPNGDDAFPHNGATSVTVVVALSTLRGPGMTLRLLLGAAAREAFGERPYSIRSIQRDELTGTALVTLVPRRPGARSAASAPR